MCGIAGYAALDPRMPLDATHAAAMLACVAHRGPDDHGVHAAAGIVLGHRRLSVIDVAGGHQPIHGARQSTVAVVNGEIYNYRELRAELDARGHAFRTGSDSEVVAHAYDAWGLDFLDRLDGMFAFALWDGERRRLLLARDRLGEKPLYHASAGGLLLFASELTALRAHPACPDTIDEEALSAYLALEYVPAPATILAGVRKLEPATALLLEDGRARIHRYWELRPPSSAPPPYEDAVTELRRRLEGAVRSRLVSDVPVGVFLSGGLDSSVIAALAVRERSLDTFSIAFTEASFDESTFAREVARHIGSRHHEQVLRGDEMIDLVPHLPSILDEPIGDASIVPTHALSRFARERVTVALGGDGGDELFAGYPMHQAHRVAPWLRRVPGVAHRTAAGLASLPRPSERNFSLGFRVRTLMRGSSWPPPENHGRWMASFSPEEQERLLTPETWAAAGGGHSAFAALHRAWERTTGWPPLTRTGLLDLYTYLPNDILTKVDRASMAVALEVRAPYLARAVVEFAATLPDAYRMRGLQGKRILRDVARDLLPASILRRPKKGFGIPVAAWLRGPLRTLLQDTLEPAGIRAAGLFDATVVHQLVGEHLSRRRDHRKPLWTLLVFELWRRHGRRTAADVPAVHTGAVPD